MANNNTKQVHLLSQERGSLEPDYITMKAVTRNPTDCKRTGCLSDLHNVGRNNLLMQNCFKHNQVKGLSNPKQKLPNYDQIFERLSEESGSIRGPPAVCYPDTFPCNDIRQKDNQAGFTSRLRSSAAISVMFIFMITGLFGMSIALWRLDKNGGIDLAIVEQALSNIENKSNARNVDDTINDIEETTAENFSIKEDDPLSWAKKEEDAEKANIPCCGHKIYLHTM
jgi:hypothetical protein